MDKKKKEKAIMRAIAILTAVNFLIVAGFMVYLYFWIKAH